MGGVYNGSLEAAPLRFFGNDPDKMPPDKTPQYSLTTDLTV